MKKPIRYCLLLSAVGWLACNNGGLTLPPVGAGPTLALSSETKNITDLTEDIIDEFYKISVEGDERIDSGNIGKKLCDNGHVSEENGPLRLEDLSGQVTYASHISAQRANNDAVIASMTQTVTVSDHEMASVLNPASSKVLNVNQLLLGKFFGAILGPHATLTIDGESHWTAEGTTFVPADDCGNYGGLSTNYADRLTLTHTGNASVSGDYGAAVAFSITTIMEKRTTEEVYEGTFITVEGSVAIRSGDEEMTCVIKDDTADHDDFFYDIICP